MGSESLVYGGIVSPTWEAEDRDRLHRMNREVLLSLPQEDEWPTLTRGLFHLNDEPWPYGGYRSRFVLLGGTFKEIEWDWPEWLAKFEDLLRRLFWTEVFLHLRTEMSVGHHDYLYEAEGTSNWSDQEPLRPVARWKFSGGPRRFEC